MRRLRALVPTLAAILLSLAACTPGAPQTAAGRVPPDLLTPELRANTYRISRFVVDGRMLEAESELAAIRRQHGDVVTGIVRNNIADILANEGKLQLALDVLDRGEVAEPGNAAYRGTRYVVLMAAGQPARALEVVRSPAEAPGFLRGARYLDRGLALFALGHLDEAAADLRVVVADREADFLRGEAALWLYYVSFRKGLPDNAMLSQEASRLGQRWPADLMLHVLGQVPADKVSDRVVFGGRAGVCLLQFFSGVAAERRGDKATARLRYGQAEKCQPVLRPQWFARSALQRL